ncbi:MAG: class I SAM-dependent methyltransferase [Verrucomicrobia bacterium]|nr:class I SAM-dependent methyltransferase [Verrucomicrobiota bacterium]
MKSPILLVWLKSATDGLFRGITGVDYCRFREWPLAEGAMNLEDGMEVLDVGSGDASFFPLLLALKRDIRLTVLDYSDTMVVLKNRFDQIISKRLTKTHPSYINADARKTPFPKNSFDRISCVSTIEHIPEFGDIESIREFERILKPGGRLVVTVPMTANARDEYKMNHVYERTADGGPVFFQRIYDFQSLENRILSDTKLRCVNKRFLIEPRRQYFWEQDCPREHRSDFTLLHTAPIQSRLSRALMLWRSMYYIREVGEKVARQCSSKLIAGIVVLEK